MNGTLNTGRLLNAYGGQVHVYGQASQGAFPVVANKMKGDWTLGANEASDRFSIRHSKLIVLWGWNSGWSMQGSPTYHFLAAKKAGAKIIMVDPWLSPTAQALADQWIPVRPGTDSALLAAVAYTMIENNWQDQEFLNQYTVGFDAEHMSKGAESKENFKDYILGNYDNTPKTPEWASRICGTSPNVIRQLAKDMATMKPMALKSSQAPARTHKGANFAQMYYTVGWMTGNVGLLGAEVTAGSSLGGSPFGGPPLLTGGPSNVPPVPNPICPGPRGGSMGYSGVIGSGKYTPDFDKIWGIAYADAWNAVLNGEYVDFAQGNKPIDIQCIYKIGPGAPLNQLVGAAKGYEAFRKVEFVVSSDLFMTTDCLFSDIVLPAISPWEAWGSNSSITNREIILFYSQVTNPLFEAKSDAWMETEIGKRLGIPEKTLAPLSEKQSQFNVIANANVIKEDGKGYEPLVEVTQSDLGALGLEGTVHPGRIPLKQMMEQGIYQVQRYENDPYLFIYQEAFRKDPEKNPLNTGSGKLEIYCQALYDIYQSMGYQDLAPIAKYEPALEGYEEAQKGDYPLQLITIHHMRHTHSTFSNVKALNELFANSLLINPVDAEKNGLQNDDSGLISSKHGKVARRINITSRIAPGVVMLGQGNWTDLDKDNVDIGANVNTLLGPILTGEAHQAYNSCLIKVEKLNGEALVPDYKRPQRIFN